MGKKRGFNAGVWDALGFIGFTAEVSRLVMAQRLKESGEYKKLGYDNWEDYCNEQFRCSKDAMDRKLKQLKEIGPHVLGSCREMGLEWQEIKLLAMSDQKENLKKGFILIEGKKTPVDEENADKIQLYISNIQKDEKITTSKLEGINKEHKKEVKSMQDELDFLKTQLPDKKDIKWALSYMEDVEKIFNQFDLALRHFAFDKRIFEDPAIPANISGVHERMVMRLKEFSIDWNVFLYEEWGETE